MQRNLLMAGASILGILFVILGVVYAITPAGSLPHFIPGYSMGLLKHHYTHAVGSIIVGCGLFAFAWFQSGKKE